MVLSSWLDPNGSDADMYAYDDFTLAADQALVEVRWRGGYQYGAPYGKASHFTITFFESIAGGSQPHVTNPQLPEVFLAQYTVGGNAGELYAETAGGIAYYDYAFALPEPFFATKGVKYWIRIEAAQSGYPDWGLAVATGGDSHHFAFSTGAARFWTATGDAAFSLIAWTGPTAAIALSAAPGDGGAVTGAHPYPAGSTATVTATPNPSYVFVHWTENGIPVSAQARYTFAASAARSLVAQFAHGYTVTAGASPSSGGSVSGDGPYPAGTSVTLTATANPNYTFVNWTENGIAVSANASYVFTLDANRTLVANFIPAQGQTISAYTQTASPAGGVLKSSWYPPDGLDGDAYVFDSFTLNTAADITEITWRGGYTNFLSGAGKSPVFDFTISIFPSIGALIQPDVTAAPLARYTVGGNAGEIDAGTIGGVPLFDYAFTLPAPFHAAAGVKYWVQIEASQGLTPMYYWPPDWGLTTGVNGDGSYFRSITGGTLGGGTLYQSMTGDTAFSLRIPAPPSCTIVVTAAPPDGGAVSGGGATPVGGQVSVLASPNPGYTFVAWTEGGTMVSANASYSFTASIDRNLVAEFTAIPGYAPPTVSITSAAPSATHISPIPVTVTFDKPVSGFTIADITVGNGSARAFAGAGANYSFDLAPTAPGLVTADIAAAAAQDSSGAPNTAAPRFVRIYEAPKGDVNSDGVIDAVDVQLTINAALGLPIGGLSGDVNHDGAVDAVDVQLTINSALGL